MIFQDQKTLKNFIKLFLLSILYYSILSYHIIISNYQLKVIHNASNLIPHDVDREFEVAARSSIPQANCVVSISSNSTNNVVNTYIINPSKHSYPDI